MQHLWQFLRDSGNREIFSWVGGGITALISAVWVLFVYFDGSTDVDKRPAFQISADDCISDGIHPRSPEIVQRVHERMTTADLVYGWKGGAANDGDTARESSFPITDVVTDDATLTIHYNWQHGELRLKPIVPIYGSVRIPIDADLRGSWLQDNGHGCVELLFHPIENGVIASGWWSRSGNPDQRFTSFVRLGPTNAKSE